MDVSTINETLNELHQKDTARLAVAIDKGLKVPAKDHVAHNPYNVSTDVSQRYSAKTDANPAGLHLLSYMTPMAVFVGAKQRCVGLTRTDPRGPLRPVHSSSNGRCLPDSDVVVGVTPVWLGLTESDCRC